MPNTYTSPVEKYIIGRYFSNTSVPFTSANLETRVFSSNRRKYPEGTTIDKNKHQSDFRKESCCYQYSCFSFSQVDWYYWIICYFYLKRLLHLKQLWVFSVVKER